MTGAIDMRIVPVLCLIFDVLSCQLRLEDILWYILTHSSTNGNTSSLLFWCLVDLTVVHELSAALLRQVLRDGSGQRSLSVIDVLSHQLRDWLFTRSKLTPMVPMLRYQLANL